MKRIFTPLLLTTLVLQVFTASADKKNVLFLGNSYTYFSDMPKMISDIAISLGDTVTRDSNTPGGYTALQHSTNTTSLAKIAQGGWDYVALQCQSQEPSFSPGQVMNDTYPYLKYLDSTIQATNTCAETLFFMTWGRKNGDASNCANYPPICTYNGMQQRLRESYLLFADSFSASVSPVGAAWKVMRDNNPTIDLYNPDESHPSVNGTYLAACVFYCTIFKKSCVGSMFLPGGVGNGDALIMQQVASMVVLDSLENWQGQGGIPDASFTGGTWPGSGSAATFTNTSKRYATSAWDFGDGSPIDNSTNPTHIYPSVLANYTVCLEVTSACGKKDSICNTINVDGTTSSRQFAQNDKIKVSQYAKVIHISNEIGTCEVSLLDLNGRRLKSLDISKGQYQIRMNQYAQGIYIIKIRSRNKLIAVQKVYNY